MEHIKTITFKAEEVYWVWAALMLADTMARDKGFLQHVRQLFEYREEATGRRLADEHGYSYTDPYIIGKAFDLLADFDDTSNDDTPAETAEEKLAAHICSDVVPLPDFILRFDWDDDTEGDD